MTQAIAKAKADNNGPQATAPVHAAETPPAAADDRKARLRKPLFIAGPVVLAVIALAVYLLSGRYVDTDNAYLKADKVTISAEVTGPITSIAVHENQQVKAGAELFRIDDRPYRIALQRADAQLRTVMADIEALKANYRQVSEQLLIAKSNVDFNERELARQSRLAKQKLTPEARLDQAQHDYDNARRQVAVIEQQQAQLLSQLDGNANIPVPQHSRYLAAQAARDAAELDLQHTIVRAPFAGITSKVPQLGQYISAGNPVMSVIATSNLWIEANFMETDLTRVHPGQPVKIEIDTYPGRVWHGSVQSIAQATGAEFSVLPPQNASGNWVKVVQRIPVRITIDTHPNDPPLRVGMTAFVKIDTRAPAAGK